MSTIDPMIWLAVTYLGLATACALGMAIPAYVRWRASRAVVRERYCTRPCCRGSGR